MPIGGLKKMKNRKLKILDLFSGIGGFHLGLKKAGIHFEEVYYSDIDKYANAIYQYNFTEAKGLGDVKTINAHELPKGRWVVTFGFPCQDLSIAGKRAGFEGKRSSLFYEAIRIIRDLQPDIFIFENVKGLFSSNEGHDIIAVLREISDIGLYDCEWQLVNTRWVLPQNRERIYFIGHLAGKSEPKVFPIGESSENDYWKCKIVNCIDANYGKGDNRPDNKSCRTLIEVAETNKNSQGQRIYDPNGISCQLTAQGGGQGAKTGLYAIDLKTAHGSSKTRKGGIKKNETMALDHNCNIGVNKHSNIRRLTPIECERLQGFPDGWTSKGNFDNEIKEISDTQRYKMIGNAVTVDIVKMIGERLAI